MTINAGQSRLENAYLKQVYLIDRHTLHAFADTSLDELPINSRGVEEAPFGRAHDLSAWSRH